MSSKIEEILSSIFEDGNDEYLGAEPEFIMSEEYTAAINNYYII